ncbi:MAG: type III-A CRISPR-associated RAMP protein Csm5 [Comamonadaceae bacterium]|nr:type III-A CRISPR-associated RAMP protein Csm5 [Comamonadaceae bacterium]
MNTFLKTYKLALTPLSPIHIGCGEDFEPTNYVIDDGTLHGFDPSRAILDARQLEALGKASSGTDPLAIQRFFKSNTKTFLKIANVKIPVCAGIKDEYAGLGQAANVERNGKPVINQFFIERHEYTGPEKQPYIPGSSFKGAVRTAWLDALNGKQQPGDVQFKFNGEAKSTVAMETRLFRGDFKTSPLRLLKVSDFMPTDNLNRKIWYAVNLKRQPVKNRHGELVVPKGATTRKECIQAAQFRSLTADVTLPVLGAESAKSGEVPATALRQTDLLTIGKKVNDYHLPRLMAELNPLSERGFVNPHWMESVTKLISTDLHALLSTGKVLLVRLGRYGGAESKTLSGDGVAQIKIMEGKGADGKNKFSFQSHTKTVWLAAENDKANKHLLPFGWALVEIDPTQDEPVIFEWCKTWSKGLLTQNLESPENQQSAKVAEKYVWTAARIKFNRANGTLTVDHDGKQASAISPTGELLLSALPAVLQTKIRRNEFVKATATVEGKILLKVEP